jgi:hypothetical protein
LRQGPGPQFALADKNVLAILRLGAEQIQDPLQIAAMSAVDIRLELPREVEAAGIDAKGHGVDPMLIPRCHCSAAARRVHYEGLIAIAKLPHCGPMAASLSDQPSLIATAFRGDEHVPPL